MKERHWFRDSVEPRLDKKKKRRIFICWFLGVGLLLSTIGMTFSYLMEIPRISSLEENIENNVSNNEHLSNHISNDDSSHILNNDESLNINNDENDKEINQEDIENNNAINSDKNQSKSSNIASINQIRKSKYDVNFYDLNVGQSNIDEANIFIIKAKESIDLGENELIDSQAENDDSKSISTDEIIDEVSEEEKKKDEVDDDENKKPIKKSTKKKKKKKKKWRKKWGPYFYSSASVSYPMRRLVSDGSATGNQLLDIKNQHESSLEAYQFSADFKIIQKRKGLILSVGLNYENINERLKYKQETTEIEMQTVVINTLVGGDSSVISTEEGIIEVTTITEREISIYNSYRFVNIPIGIGYQAKFKKFNMEYEAGLDINVFFKAKGFTFNKELQVIDLSRNMKDTAVKPALWTSVRLVYPINDAFSLTGAAQIKYQPSSISKKEYELRQHFFSPGISLGAKILIQ